MVRLIGFTGDARALCKKHAEEIYGPDIWAFLYPALDNEGNIVQPVFDIDEVDTPMVCDVPHGHRPDGSPIFDVLD